MAAFSSYLNHLRLLDDLQAGSSTCPNRSVFIFQKLVNLASPEAVAEICHLAIFDPGDTSGSVGDPDTAVSCRGDRDQMFRQQAAAVTGGIPLK